MQRRRVLLHALRRTETPSVPVTQPDRKPLQVAGTPRRCGGLSLPTPFRKDSAVTDPDSTDEKREMEDVQEEAAEEREEEGGYQ